MTVNEFISECKRSFGGKVELTPGLTAIYHEKLRRFTSEELSAIYDKVLETVEYFPKVKHIYAAASDLGFLQREMDNFQPHRWDDSDCRLCHGEGRLCVTWIATAEVANERLREVQALSRIIGYKDSCDSQKFVLQEGEFRSLFRCACMAGDSSTIPKSWPKWRKDISPVRYV